MKHVFTDPQALLAELSKEMLSAMQEVDAKGKAKAKENAEQFYSQGSPVMYSRTGKYGDAPDNVEKLNAVLDGQNEITNKNSVSMEDMAAATTKAASMASEMGVAEDSLSAMIGTIEARTKASGEEVGTGIKSLLINLQNINNSKIVSTLDKAGISMTELKDGVEQMRDPISILEDLQKVFNSLDESDPLRSEILTNIGQKYHAKVCVAVQKCAA